jgi:hypothetical protein
MTQQNESYPAVYVHQLRHESEYRRAAIERALEQLERLSQEVEHTMRDLRFALVTLPEDVEPG